MRRKLFNIKERVINPIVWIILMYWLISLWVGELSATIPWGFVLRTQIHILDLNTSELGFTAMEIRTSWFFCALFHRNYPFHIFIIEWLWFSQKENQMNNILLQMMEWLIYHSIEIILLILCVIGWKLWWEISWEMRRWIP